MDNQPTDADLEQAAETFDLGALPQINHRFDRIVGNQLMCTMHQFCTSITVPPTAVLEPNAKGELVLRDNRAVA